MPTTVSTEGLSAAVRERLKYPGRSEADIANHTGYSVSLRTERTTPFAEPQKIDTELKVSTDRYITKSGTLSKRKRTSYGMGDIKKDVPLTALIVMARVNPNSNYNQRTNQRYLLSQNPFKGVTRAEGIQRMKELVQKMVSGRHKSSKFILSGWIPAIKKLASFVKDKTGTLSDNSFYNGDERGGATPAVEGDWSVSASIENRTGLEGVNAVNANVALLKYGTTPLQQAIDEEERLMREYMEKKYKPLNDKFNAMCR